MDIDFENERVTARDEYSDYDRRSEFSLAKSTRKNIKKNHSKQSVRARSRRQKKD